MRKLVSLSFILCTFVLGKSYANSEDTAHKDEKIQAEIQNELKLAEADMEEDEDLFMDEGSETSGDWSEEDAGENNTNNFAEEVPHPESPEPAPHHQTEPTPKEASMTPPQKNHPKPTAKVKPTPMKPAPAMKKQPQKAQKTAAPKNRVPASFKQGFKTTSSTCSLHSKPSSGSQVILSSKTGKKVWLEGHNDSWYKGYHKGGHGYFPASCFNH